MAIPDDNHLLSLPRELFEYILTPLKLRLPPLGTTILPDHQRQQRRALASLHLVCRSLSAAIRPILYLTVIIDDAVQLVPLLRTLIQNPSTRSLIHEFASLDSLRPHRDWPPPNLIYHTCFEWNRLVSQVLDLPQSDQDTLDLACLDIERVDMGQLVAPLLMTDMFPNSYKEESIPVRVLVGVLLFSTNIKTLMLEVPFCESRLSQGQPSNLNSVLFHAIEQEKRKKSFVTSVRELRLQAHQMTSVPCGGVHNYSLKPLGLPALGLLPNVSRLDIHDHLLSRDMDIGHIAGKDYENLRNLKHLGLYGMFSAELSASVPDFLLHCTELESLEITTNWVGVDCITERTLLAVTPILQSVSKDLISLRIESHNSDSLCYSPPPNLPDRKRLNLTQFRKLQSLTIDFRALFACSRRWPVSDILDFLPPSLVHLEVVERWYVRDIALIWMEPDVYEDWLFDTMRKLAAATRGGLVRLKAVGFGSDWLKRGYRPMELDFVAIQNCFRGSNVNLNWIDVSSRPEPAVHLTKKELCYLDCYGG